MARPRSALSTHLGPAHFRDQVSASPYRGRHWRRRDSTAPACPGLPCLPRPRLPRPGQPGQGRAARAGPGPPPCQHRAAGPGARDPLPPRPRLPRPLQSRHASRGARSTIGRGRAGPPGPPRSHEATRAPPCPLRQGRQGQGRHQRQGRQGRAGAKSRDREPGNAPGGQTPEPRRQGRQGLAEARQTRPLAVRGPPPLRGASGATDPGGPTKETREACARGETEEGRRPVRYRQAVRKAPRGRLCRLPRRQGRQGRAGA